MRPYFEQSSVKIERWASREELNRHLAAYDQKLVIESPADYERDFYTATFESELLATQPSCLAVGLCSEGHGLTPQLLPLPHLGLLLFGLNREVVAIRGHGGEIAYRIPLEFLFRSMTHLADKELLLLFHEIGVTAIRETGQAIWSFSLDVLEDAAMEGDSLRLAFMDSPPVTLELLSGRELK